MIFFLTFSEKISNYKTLLKIKGFSPRRSCFQPGPQSFFINKFFLCVLGTFARNNKKQPHSGNQMKIMLAYDRSTKISEKSLEMAKKHAEAFDAKVYVVTSMIGGRDIPQEDFRLAEKELAYAENLLKAEEIPCEARVLVGGLSPGEALVEFAKEHKIDEIIVGVRKKSRLEKLVLGSTAQYIILNSPCPVLSVV